MNCCVLVVNRVWNKSKRVNMGNNVREVKIRDNGGGVKIRENCRVVVEMHQGVY